MTRLGAYAKLIYSGGLIGLLLLVQIGGSPWARVEASADSTTRLVVELRDAFQSPADIIPGIPARHVRQLTNRPPRTYEVSGQRRRARDLRRWHVVEVASQQATTVYQQLSRNPAVSNVHYEQVYQPAVVPNDPRFADQYGLSSTNGLADIQAPAAWEKTTGSSNAVIAIIDGGVDLDHEDLVNKIWVNGDEIAGNGIDDDGNGFADDIHGWDFVAAAPSAVAIDHATHVAGIAAASSNNSIGVAGVDWSAKIMSIRVLTTVARESDVIAGIQYAVNNGADIINMSLAGPGSPVLLAAVEDAYAAGVVVVAAAGNSGRDTAITQPYPACADGGANMVLGVGATDEDGQPAFFSNFGSCVDVAAPGEGIVSTKTGDRYGSMTGTSMSSPFAAGVAGLYLAIHPGATPADVMAALAQTEPFSGAQADAWNRDYKGRLNAAKVVGAASETSKDSEVSTPAPQQSSDSESSSEPDGGGGGGSGDGGGGPSTSSGSDGGGDPEPTSQQPSSSPRKVAGAVKKLVNKELLAKINAAFRSVFGRNPIVAEHSYWYARVFRGERRSYGELVGAMLWRKLQGSTYDPLYDTRSPAKIAGTSSTSLVSRINALHRQAYGRNPTASEHIYWMSRVVRGEKKSEAELVGAMLYHRLMGILH